MEFIVAVDENWGIGKDGGMLDHLPKDLAFFKKKTSGHVIVMGRKTLESFPGSRPLPNRVNIVVTSQSDYKAADGVVLVYSLAELAQLLKTMDREDVFLVGGATLYATLKDYCSGGYVTHIGHAYDGVQAFFPDLAAEAHWQLQETLAEDEEHGYTLQFCYYRNQSPRSLEEFV